MNKDPETKECKHCDNGKVPVFIPDENSEDGEKFIGYDDCEICLGSGVVDKDPDDYSDEQDAIDNKADMARD